MIKFDLRAVVCILLFSFSVSAFADDPQSEPKKVAVYTPSSADHSFTQEDIQRIKKILTEKPPEENSVTVYGLIQALAFFTDSLRTNTPDFVAKTARVGTIVRGGVMSGQVEVQFLGNAPQVNTDNTATLLSESSSNTVVLRQAQANLNFSTLQSGENTFISRFSLGGIRLGGAVAIAPDAAAIPAGYSRQDGAFLSEQMLFAKKAKVMIGFGVFNTLFATNVGKKGSYLGWGVYQTTKQNYFGFDSSGRSKAYIYGLEASNEFNNLGTANFIGYYGFQNEAPTATNPSGYKTSYRDVDHLEVSLNFNNKKYFGSTAMISGNGVSTWFSLESGSKTKATTVTTSNDAFTNSLFGLGFGADSAEYLTNMIQKGDRLTYSAAYAHVEAKFDDSTYSNNYNVNQGTLQFGYAVNTYELAFVSEFDLANKEAFSRINVKDSTTTPRKTATRVYLTALLVF